ncbi:cyclin-like protein [Emericellopsis atlantica]|uniref:Cyclin-like protein n=1 Tax=Emericellopsis atlantica TaxID=2614577 RepID=A0A9P7ZXF4_9HYPO|nr:cyclin-like protein [Emericellopsis atlantica]KAG9259236.1 cyclin-like protein [Emericellopsis atlantica]
MAHLVNPLATPAQLYNLKSSSQLPDDLQEVVFTTTQCLTQAAGLLLELPQSTTAQASVLLARYWLVDSPMMHEFSDVSAAALFIVSKMGPLPQSARDIANVYAYLLSSQSPLLRAEKPTGDNPAEYYLSESDYYAFQNRILALEARILYALSFNTHVSLPHPLAITYLQTLDFLGLGDKKDISARVMQHLNTALLSPQMLYVTHQPHALATAAIYCAARDFGAKMPESAWWEVFDVDREELGFLVVGLMSVDNIMRKRREDMPWMNEGAVTRSKVEAEMKQRGLRVGNGTKRGNDEEDEVMRMMDSR